MLMLVRAQETNQSPGEQDSRLGTCMPRVAAECGQGAAATADARPCPFPSVWGFGSRRVCAGSPLSMEVFGRMQREGGREQEWGARWSQGLHSLAFSQAAVQPGVGARGRLCHSHWGLERS